MQIPIFLRYFISIFLNLKHLKILPLSSKCSNFFSMIYTSQRQCSDVQAYVTGNTYNPGYNILQLYNILVQIRLTTTKRKLDIQYSKLGIRVASQVVKQLKTQDLRKLRNIRKISNLGGHIPQCLVSLQELILCEQQLKNTQKQIPNIFFLSSFTGLLHFVSSILSGIIDLQILYKIQSHLYKKLF